jgi:hypothetical protein
MSDSPASDDLKETKTRWWVRRSYWLGPTVFLLYFLVFPIAGNILWGPSKEEEEDKVAWVNCEDKILTAWAAQDTNFVRERLALTDQYTFGDDFSGLSENDISKLKSSFNWEDRTKAAEKIGVREDELNTLDKTILGECGPFPEYTDKFPYGRKKVR